MDQQPAQPEKKQRDFYLVGWDKISPFQPGGGVDPRSFLEQDTFNANLLVVDPTGRMHSFSPEGDLLNTYDSGDTIENVVGPDGYHSGGAVVAYPTRNWEQVAAMFNIQGNTGVPGSIERENGTIKESITLMNGPKPIPSHEGKWLSDIYSSVAGVVERMANTNYRSIEEHLNLAFLPGENSAVGQFVETYSKNMTHILMYGIIHMHSGMGNNPMEETKHLDGKDGYDLMVEFWQTMKTYMSSTPGQRKFNSTQRNSMKNDYLFALQNMNRLVREVKGKGNNYMNMTGLDQVTDDGVRAVMATTIMAMNKIRQKERTPVWQ